MRNEKYFPTIEQPLKFAVIIATLGVTLIAAIPGQSQAAERDSKHQMGPGLNWVQTMDGYSNNRQNPYLGSSGTIYSRIANPQYNDGVGSMKTDPPLRHLSNRVFADGAQNLFSENGVTQWAYNWGQFLDHSIGLRASGTEKVEIAFDEFDPLEFFNNSAQNMTMTRTAIADNSGELSPREQINTVSSFIDAWAVYGGTNDRLEWLREGPLDDDLSNNGARLLLTEAGYLPTANIRGDGASAPTMERVGRLHAIADPYSEVVITGDVRANENIALTTIQTLFAREHNRVVDLLPSHLSEQEKFDIARQMVIATQQYITYREFLPALGLRLKPAHRYQSKIDPSVSNEFATVGYRAHSMIHGEIEMAVPAGHFTDRQLEVFSAQGIEIEQDADKLELAVPLNVAFGNPQLVPAIGLGPIAAGLGSEPQYKNDEQIDNQLRSVLFQLPNPDLQDPDACLDGPELHTCFLLATDLGSLDVFRARDHGIADYNTLREAYGLNRIETFTELTGELTDEFPIDDPLVDINDPINDPNIMDFIELRDADGNLLKLGSDAADGEAVTGVRRTTLAARLKAIYGDVDNIDSFVGMVSEPHLPGSEFGELQYMMWKRQFEALRDGDSNFYKWNSALRHTSKRYGKFGITYRQTLANIVVNNTDLVVTDIQRNLFLVACRR